MTAINKETCKAGEGQCTLLECEKYYQYDTNSCNDVGCEGKFCIWNFLQGCDEDSSQKCKVDRLNHCNTD